MWLTQIVVVYNNSDLFQILTKISLSNQDYELFPSTENDSEVTDQIITNESHTIVVSTL